MRKLGVFILLLSLLVVLGGCIEENGSADNSSEGAQPVINQQVDNKNYIDAFGTVKSYNQRNLFVDFPAVISDIKVKEGQGIKKGDIIFQLDIKSLEADIDVKERELSIARLELEKEKSTIQAELQELLRLKNELSEKSAALSNNSHPDIKKLLSDLKYAEDLYNSSKKDLASKQALYEAEAITLNELEESRKAAEEKQKAVSDVKFSVDERKASISKEIEDIKSTIKQKEAGLGGAGKGIDEANSIKMQAEKITGIENELHILNEKINKSYMDGNKIVSDIDEGIVYGIDVVQGDMVTEGTRLASIADTGQLFIEAYIAEEFIKDVKPGAKVTIRPLADKSKEYNGKVANIFNKAVENSGETNIRVEISIDDRDGFLFPDLNVDVQIEIIS